MMALVAQRQKVRRPQGENAFLTLLPVRPDDKFDVNRIGVANRDSGLQPAKLNLPDAAKGVGASYKSAGIIGHLLSDYQKPASSP